ncbi:MAG: T9SS type A sorting domain-containing protein [Bacteroidetes bacterium]|nr:T9SS type A sorting domain-containing protein [Bacteroidota bacterium]
MKKLLSTIFFLFIIAVMNLSAQLRVYPPSLVSPIDGAIDQMPNVILDWDAVTGIAGEVFYDVELDTDPAFPNPATFNTNFSGVQTSKLFFNETYYWKVRAIDGADISDWSEIWSFQVLNTIELNSPKDLKSEIMPDPLLKWDTISGVEYYDIQYDTVYSWKFQNVETGEDLHDIFFIDNTNGWVVGNGGNLIHYDGTEWTVIDTITDNDVFAVDFIDENNGIAVGAAGTILYFDGTIWTEDTNSVTASNLFGISMVDANNAYAVGEEGTILNYDGTEWTEITGVTDKDLNAVQFLDASNGWVAGNNGKIYYFNGTDWENQSVGSKAYFDIYFLDNTHGWVCGDKGKIYQFDGSEWTLMTNKATNVLNSIIFTDNTHGYATGAEGIYLELIRGIWLPQTIGIENDFYALLFLDENNRYAVGANGTILNFDGVAFTSPNNIVHVPHVTGEKGEVQLEHLDFAATYFWRVRARNPIDTSGWSLVRSFLTIPTVELTEPKDTSTGLGLSEEFSWKKITGILNYTIQIDSDPNFTLPMNFVVGNNSIVLDMYLLTFGTEYYWRVRANHGADTSNWSEEWNFETIYTVHNISPANGAIDIKKLPKLIWEPITGIDGYQLIYDTLDLNNPCFDEFIGDSVNEYQIITPLASGKTYYWQLRAFSGIDTTAWNTAWSFTVEGPQEINELINESLVSLYPNPSNGQLYIEYETGSASLMKIYVMDLVGQILIEKELYFDKGKSSHVIDLTNFANGIYIIRFQSGNQSFSNKISIYK